LVAKNYGVTKAPDIVLIKIKNKEWTTGINSLNLVLETIEKEEL